MKEGQTEKCNCQTELGNCSTIVVGKNASKTGKVIVGHNEDDLDVVVLPYAVPRMKHKPDEVIYLEDGKAIIPQVEETYAYYWSEMRASTWRVSFSDTFVNEMGVAITSNSCNPCKESTINPQDGDIGYGIRRILAERAKTARDGVELAISLIEKYGYFQCRSYSISDVNEGWVLQIAKGKHYVARRIGDDEVYFIPNWYTIHNVDFKDTEHKNWYFSDDLVSFAMENNWYTPAVAGDYSDFDFAKAYSGDNDKSYNILRATNGWRFLLLEEPTDNRIFSAKLNRKLGLEDVKGLLRFHYTGTPDDVTEDYNINPHSDKHWTICNHRTAEACVIELNENPALTCVWRTTLNPCTTPFVPWYVGNTKVPEGYNWYTPIAGQSTHFHTPASDNEFNPAWAFWTFQTMQYFADFDYKNTHSVIQNSVKELEAKWEGEQSLVHKTYLELLAKNPVLATEYITGYTNTQAETALNWAKNMIKQLGEAKAMENFAWEPKE